jgi:hypothetical protein
MIGHDNFETKVPVPLSRFELFSAKKEVLTLKNIYFLQVHDELPNTERR